jgi:predicted RNA binding protein YcfA (HicA-like mRNA interferase family)
VSALPRVSGREVVAALTKSGYQFDRQKGSHIILRNPSPPFRRMVVPDHKELHTGTLRAIIRESGLTVPEFISLLQR